MQWDEKELDTQFTLNVYFWTPNSEILAKALVPAKGCECMQVYSHCSAGHTIIWVHSTRENVEYSSVKIMLLKGKFSSGTKF